MRADALARGEGWPRLALVPVANVVLEAAPDGVLWWRDQGLLVVADLHLEKGSSFARRRQFLPPYDTRATLQALAAAIALYAPRRVVALGDSFHDDSGAGRLLQEDRDTLRALQAGRDWVWVAGNHDPGAPQGLPGDHVAELALGPLVFRHEPMAGAAPGEIAGHLHPAARVSGRGGSVRRRCFAGCGGRLVMPAFGAYAGGLNVLDPAFAPLFPNGTFGAWVAGADGLYKVRRASLRPD